MSKKKRLIKRKLTKNLVLKIAFVILGIIAIVIMNIGLRGILGDIIAVFNPWYVFLLGLAGFIGLVLLGVKKLT